MSQPTPPSPAVLTPTAPFDSLALRELLVLKPDFAARLKLSLKSWSGPLPLPGEAPVSLGGVHPPTLWSAYLELIRWTLECRPGVAHRRCPAPFHVLEVPDVSLAGQRLTKGLQALRRAREGVLQGGEVTDEAVRVLWNVLRAARTGEPYRDLPVRREGPALRALLAGTDLSGLHGPTVLIPPVGDVRAGQTLALFSLSESGSFPHLHWQTTAAAYVLDTVFGTGDLERVTWIYPRRRTTLSLRPEDVFLVGRGRSVGRDFRGDLARLDWTRLRQSRARTEPGSRTGQLTPVLALHLVNSAAKDTAARSALLGVPGAPAESDRSRVDYLYEMKQRGALAMLEDGLLRAAGYEDDTLLLVGETAFGRKGVHLPLRQVPDHLRALQPGLKDHGPGSPAEAQRLSQLFSLDAALSALVAYLGQRSGRRRQKA